MKLTLLLSALALVFFSNAQTFQISDQYVFGGDSFDNIRDAVKLENNTILAGDSYSGATGDKSDPNFGTGSLNSADLWIIAMGNNGGIDWQKSIGGNDEDILLKMIKTLDESLLIGAYSKSPVSGNKTAANKGGFDFWIIKMDTLGNEIWQKSFGGTGDDFLSDVIELSDGSVVLVGSSDSPISGDKSEDSNGQFDYWVIKIDQNGNVLWEKTIGGDAIDYAETVTIDMNENIIVSGRSASSLSGDKTEESYGSFDLWILKLDANGVVLWDKALGGAAGEMSSDIFISNDNIFITASSTSGISGTKSEDSRGSFDFWITKLSLNGDVLMDKTLGGNSTDILTASKLMPSGDLIIAGFSESIVSGEVQIPSHNNSQDFWILVVDTSDLNIKSQYKFGGDSDDSPFGIMETENNSLLIFGTSNSDVSGDKTLPSKGQSDFWLLELSTDLSTSNIIKEEILSIYPNPTTNTFKILNLPEGESFDLKVVDMMGKSVLQSKVSSVNSTVDVNSLSSGMYTLQMFDEKKSYTSKLIVE